MTPGTLASEHVLMLRKFWELLLPSVIRQRCGWLLHCSERSWFCLIWFFCMYVYVCMHECTKECAYVWRTKDNHGYHSSGFFRDPPFIYLSRQNLSLVWNSLSWWGWLSSKLYWCPFQHIPSTDNTSHLQRFWSSGFGPHACKHESA